MQTGRSCAHAPRLCRPRRSGRNRHDARICCFPQAFSSNARALCGRSRRHHDRRHQGVHRRKRSGGRAEGAPRMSARERQRQAAELEAANAVAAASRRVARRTLAGWSLPGACRSRSEWGFMRALRQPRRSSDGRGGESGEPSEAEQQPRRRSQADRGGSQFPRGPEDGIPISARSRQSKPVPMR